MTGTRAAKDRTPGQTHLRAVNRALQAGAGQLTAQQDALVETLRTLARQMDAAGQNPGTRLTALYLAAQRDLARVLTAKRGKGGAGGLSLLEQLRAERDAGREAG